jgi:tetratricopeptide (TPR) repeat protein
MKSIFLILMTLLLALGGSSKLFAQQSQYDIYFSAGGSSYKERNYAVAAILYRGALDIAKAAWPMTDYRVTSAADNLGLCHLNQQEYQEGLNAYIIAYNGSKSFKNANDRNTAIRSAYGLSQTLNGLKRYDEAVAYSNWGIAVLNKGTADRNYLDDFYWQIGIARQAQEKYADAERAFRASLKLVTTNDERRVLNARIGWMRYLQKDFDGGARSTMDAIRLVDSRTDAGKLTMAEEYYDLSTIYFGKPNYDAATKSAKESLRFYQLLGTAQKASVGKTQWRLAGISEQAKHYDVAKTYYLQAATTFRELSDNQSLGSVYYNLAWMAYREKQLADAETYAKKSQETHEKLGGDARLSVAWDLDLLGHIAARRKKYAEAERYYEQVVAIRAAADGQPNLADSRRSLENVRSGGAAVVAVDAEALRKLVVGSSDPALPKDQLPSRGLAPQ